MTDINNCRGSKWLAGEKKYKGKFFVKDMSEGLDTKGLDDKYHMVIANDFLEHVFNPSHIIRQSHNLLINQGLCFISVPNWRMGHNWIYKGLFDYNKLPRLSISAARVIYFLGRVFSWSFDSFSIKSLFFL